MAPLRVVSLVPSLTELIWALGAGDSLVGRTNFCTDPPDVRRVDTVGGTKNPKVDRIVALQPDLVVANREENRQEDVAALRRAGLEVVVTDPNSVVDACTMIRELGRRVGAADEAERIVAAVATALAEDAGVAPGMRTVAVIVWKEPLMVLGSSTYGNDLLGRCGAQNVFAGLARYPIVSMEDLVARRPSLILLPDEPYPFKERDVAEFAHIAPSPIVDGKLLWWYGPRMPAAIQSLRTLLERNGT